MAKRRMITSAIWDDEWFGELDFFEQALWIGLFSKCADDQGRLKDNPILIRASVFPYKDVEMSTITIALEHFEQAGRMIRYEAGGKPLIQLLKWWEHQRPQWATASQWAPPPRHVDRIRTRQNGQYLELNWKPKDATIPKAQSSPEEPSRTVRAGRQSPVPVPVPVPVPEDTTESPKSGDSVGPPPAQTFQEWQERVEKAKNKPAELQLMFEALYPGRDPPGFGYLGKVAKQVGGYGRLAELMWQHSTRPPTGDVLAYLQKVAKGGRANGRAKRSATGDGEPDGFSEVEMRQIVAEREANAGPP